MFIASAPDLKSGPPCNCSLSDHSVVEAEMKLRYESDAESYDEFHLILRYVSSQINEAKRITLFEFCP